MSLLKFFLILAAAGVLLAAVGLFFSLKLAVRHYTLASAKLRGPKTLRMALISDLHARRYGKKQEKLAEILRAEKPDLLLFAGDVVAEDKDRTPALELLDALGKNYPCFYVTGNHEYRSGKPEEVREIVRSYGLTVLRGESVLFDTECGKIRIAGIDDMQEAGFDGVLAQAKAALEGEKSVFTVFLCHHPELPVCLAKEHGLFFDLAVSGHAHGGQWRLPGVINGLYAPHQGLFPKYAGGFYDLGEERTLIVGRGLAGNLPIPRLFNPPELVIIDVKPA